MKNEILVVHGPPGSGKTTQCLKYSELTGIAHVSAGDLIRDIRNGKRASAYLDQVRIVPGRRVDDIIINSVVIEALVKELKGKDGAIIDGYPRFADAVSIFIESITESGLSIAGCIEFLLDEETSLARLRSRGQRAGENENNDEFLTGRYHDHNRYTLPAISHLVRLSSCKHVTIGASKAVEQVGEDFTRTANTILVR